jgi:hypothetical protein
VLSVHIRTALAAVLAAGLVLMAQSNDARTEANSTIAELAGPLILNSGPTRFVLSSPRTAGPPLASRLDRLPTERHIYLVFRNLYSAEAPGVLYHVYLDLPEGVRPGKDDVHRVGFLNFFQAGRITESGKAATDESAFRSFDVTVVAKTLRSRGLLKGTTSVTVIPGAPPSENAMPTVGRIELVEQ